MFERFNEEARRALFFARAKTVQRQGDSISPEDLLGGIVWALPQLLARFGAKSTNTLTPAETAEEFMSRLNDDRGILAAHASKEVPFSRSTRLALEVAAEEADGMHHTTIRPGHLLLGLLRAESSEARHALDEAGVTLHELRRIMAQDPEQS